VSTRPSPSSWCGTPPRDDAEIYSLVTAAQERQAAEVLQAALVG
jgi:hypothetical protein